MGEQPAIGVFVGLGTLDVIHRVESAPHANEKITASSQFIAAGGPAANAAVTFAALGGRATLLTVLGASTIAEVARRDLEAHRVRVIDFGPALLDPPPVSSIFVTESTGDRAIVGGEGLLSLETPVDRQAIARQLAGAEVVLVDGHHADLSLVATETAQASGTPVVLDAGRWKPSMERLIAHSSDVVASSDFLTPGADSSEQTASRIMSAGVPRVAVTAGHRPVRWWADAERGEVEAPPSAARDTLGAGDVFHGAYAYRRATHPDEALEGWLRFAAAIASKRCEYIGPRSWIEAIARCAADWDLT